MVKVTCFLPGSIILDATMNPSPAPLDRPCVLLIDDDRKLCRLITDYLAPLGYEVSAVHSGPEGIERALGGERFSAVILDVMLPGGLDGFEVLRRLRAGSDVPVLMLTARGEETDRIVGLEMGADDYLPKTFSSRELLARLRAVTRRRVAPGGDTDADSEELVVGPLRLQPAARTAALGEAPLTLTPVEYDLLLALARGAGRVRTRERLLEEICEREYEAFDRSIDVHISTLRRKLGDNPKEPNFIRTVRAVGYMMIDPEKA